MKAGSEKGKEVSCLHATYYGQGSVVRDRRMCVSKLAPRPPISSRRACNLPESSLLGSSMASNTRPTSGRFPVLYRNSICPPRVLWLRHRLRTKRQLRDTHTWFTRSLLLGPHGVRSYSVHTQEGPEDDSVPIFLQKVNLCVNDRNED